MFTHKIKNDKPLVGWVKQNATQHKSLQTLVYKLIASVNFGETRRFLLKPRDKNNPSKYEVNLSHGSVLIMSGETQKYWLHQIPKTSKKLNPRINLTFRFIY